MLKSFSFVSTFSHTNYYSKLKFQKLSESFICFFWFFLFVCFCFLPKKSCRMLSPCLPALNRAGKIRFSATQKSVLLKASSGERCGPHNIMLLVTLGGTCVSLIVYLVMHQMK